MDEGSKGRFKARYALPVLFTLATLLSLRYRSTTPYLFHRYSLIFLFFFAVLIVITVQAWRVAMDERKWLALSHRLAIFPVFQIAVIAVCALFLLDLVIDPLEIIVLAIRGNIWAIGFLLVVAVLLALIYMLGSRSRKILGRVGILLVSVCISVVAVELIFRCFLLTPRIPRTEGQFRRIVTSTWPSPITPAKPPETYRILGLSDSFGQVGGRKNYHYLLPWVLSGPSPRCEVVNFSVIEYELSDELALLRRFGPSFAPDLVLQGFTVGNDFDSSSEPLLCFRGISIREPAGFGSLRPGNFAVRNWLRRFLIFRRDCNKKKSEARHNVESGTFSRDGFLGIQRDRLEVCDLEKPEDALLEITKVLDKISDQALEMGAEYVIVIHPDQYQVEPDLFLEICERYRLSPDRYDLQRPQRLIADYCRKKGIDCIDLLPAFRERGAGGGLYLLRDTHYNDRGNRLAASEVAEFLNRRFSSESHNR